MLDTIPPHSYEPYQTSQLLRIYHYWKTICTYFATIFAIIIALPFIFVFAVFIIVCLLIIEKHLDIASDKVGAFIWAKMRGISLYIMRLLAAHGGRITTISSHLVFSQIPTAVSYVFHRTLTALRNLWNMISNRFQRPEKIMRKSIHRRQRRKRARRGKIGNHGKKRAKSSTILLGRLEMDIVLRYPVSGNV